MPHHPSPDRPNPDHPSELHAARRRPQVFIIDVGLAVVCAALAVLTAFVPDWIERLIGMAPDDGSGELEWGIVLAFAVAAATFGWFARAEWRRWKRMPA